jgi:hypothetical protein
MDTFFQQYRDINDSDSDSDYDYDLDSPNLVELEEHPLLLKKPKVLCRELKT